jgi:hypothetical protein
MTKVPDPSVVVDWPVSTTVTLMPAWCEAVDTSLGLRNAVASSTVPRMVEEAPDEEALVGPIEPPLQAAKERATRTVNVRTAVWKVVFDMA